MISACRFQSMMRPWPSMPMKASFAVLRIVLVRSSAWTSRRVRC
jgi:hypothetical protein